MFTCGLYMPFWYMKRRSFLESIDGSARIGQLQEWYIGLWAVSMICTVVGSVGKSKGFEMLGSLANLAAAIVVLTMAFRTKALLERYLSRMNLPERLSGLATFFLQIYYLQYRINRLPESSDVASAFD
jgi:hypothetical protein